MDITEIESFINLDYWLGQLKQNAHPSIVVCLMANKVDLAQTKRAVSTLQIQEYAVRHDLIFVGECSALENFNVKESVEALVK